MFVAVLFANRQNLAITRVSAGRWEHASGSGGGVAGSRWQRVRTVVPPAVKGTAVSLLSE